MKDYPLLENERICEECGCIYHIHNGCCSTLPCDVTEENYELVKQVVNVQNKVWDQLTDEQKVGWYMDGTVGFTSYVIDILGIKENTLSEKELEYCVDCLTYEAYIWDLANKAPIHVPNDIHQMYDILRLVWNLLSLEQKTSIEEAGTLGFVDNVLHLIGYNVDNDISKEEYTSCVELVYTLQQFDKTMLSTYQQVKELGNMIEVALDSESEDLHYDCELFRDKVRTILEFMSSKISK